MRESDVAGWVDRYTSAWGSNDPEQIGSLFTSDAEYFTAPFRTPWRGRQGIIDGWLARRDEPGSWNFSYEVDAIAGNRSFVKGRTEYPGDTTYRNLWEITLNASGDCLRFVEWWMVE